MTDTAGLSRPDPGDFPPPTLETLPEAVATNVAIARARTRARIMAVVKAGVGAPGLHGRAGRGRRRGGMAWHDRHRRGVELRTAGLTVPILTWLNPSGVDAEAAAANQIDIAIGSVDELEALLKRASSSVRVHLNLDTGMAREGCPCPSGTR